MDAEKFYLNKLKSWGLEPNQDFSHTYDKKFNYVCINYYGHEYNIKGKYKYVGELYKACWEFIEKKKSEIPSVPTNEDHLKILHAEQSVSPIYRTQLEEICAQHNLTLNLEIFENEHKYTCLLYIDSDHRKSMCYAKMIEDAEPTKRGAIERISKLVLEDKLFEEYLNEE